MSGHLSAINRTVGPVMLMIYSPNMVIFMRYAAVHCDGSFNELLMDSWQESGDWGS